MRVLMVEDQPEDAERWRHALSQHGYQVHARRVATEEQLALALRQDTYDVVLCDFDLPGWSVQEALELLRGRPCHEETLWSLEFALALVAWRTPAHYAIRLIGMGCHGNEALATFKPGQFDLVLTDWNMPGKTGLEVVQGIRAQDPKVPIIMITTEAEKSRVMQAIQAGVSDYLVKPFTADTLRQKLEKHCAQFASA